jgi:hypothetical protein
VQQSIKDALGNTDHLRLLEGLNVGVDGYYKICHDQLDLAQLAGSVVTAPLDYRESRGWGSDFSLTYERNGLSALLLPKTSFGVTECASCAAGRRDVRVPAHRTNPTEVRGGPRS